MKKIDVQEAVGHQLFHDMTAIMEGGYKGARFKRGHVVKPEDIPVLLDMGKNHIFVWEDDPDLVHEEDAAREVVERASCDSIVIGEPSEGRYALRSAMRGLFVLDRAGLRAINEVPDYTFATLRDRTPVEEGDIVAGCRIVPLVTSRERVERAKGAADEHAPVFSVLPYRPLKVGIVITGSEIFEGRIKDAFQPILKRKIAYYGGTALPAVICPDDLEIITGAVRGLYDQGADLILMTGGMSVDPDDLTPTAIRQLSDEFVFQGMPVQPGNMLTAGYLGDTVLLGVPGASMHSRVTSLDVFLPRIFAGLRLTAEQAVELGEGGLSLCREFPVLEVSEADGAAKDEAER